MRGPKLHPIASSDAPLRIAVIAPPWFEIPPRGYGGIESMVYWLVRGLCERGHDVTLVAAGASHTAARFVQTYAEPPSARLGEAFPEAYHATLAARALERLDLDVIHDHSFVGPLLAGGSQVPTLVTAHGPADGPMADYYANLGPNVHLVAISDSQRRIAPGLPWLQTVHNAIPVTEYPWSRDKDDFVLFLGRMGEEKGAHLAIEAAREAGRRIVIAAKCQEPTEVEYFERQIRPRLGPGVDFVGQVEGDRKKDLLARARCLVFPIQWNEPFGIVMIEAMACGTPVVAMNRGSVPEVIADGVTGVICDDLRDFPAAIERAGDLDPAACRARVEERFDIATMVTRYEEAYRLAIGRPMVLPRSRSRSQSAAAVAAGP